MTAAAVRGPTMVPPDPGGPASILRRCHLNNALIIVECVRQVLDGDREWKREWRKRAES
jgi:hypothetical protein